MGNKMAWIVEGQGAKTPSPDISQNIGQIQVVAH